MRVVNSVERGMMRAEWENWLLDENTRCKQVQTVLRENRTGISASKRIPSPDSQVGMDSKEKGRKLEAFRRWQGEYCESCKKEQGLLFRGMETTRLYDT
jgi:hypothetical protein